MKAIVGIDFDNTIVGYDALVHAVAVDRGLVPASTPPVKRIVRDVIRRRPDGEVDWQKLQAVVYGPLMPQARLIDGVPAFVRACRAAGLRLFIVSHKTELARYDETATNLRAAAHDWMRAQGFFEPRGFGLGPDDVFFEGTRAAKIARISSLGCSHFIDDLEEVFLEPSFPSGVEKLLLSSDAVTPADDIKVMTSWPAIHEHFFGRAV